LLRRPSCTVHVCSLSAPQIELIIIHHSSSTFARRKMKRLRRRTGFYAETFHFGRRIIVVQEESKSEGFQVKNMQRELPPLPRSRKRPFFNRIHIWCIKSFLLLLYRSPFAPNRCHQGHCACCFKPCRVLGLERSGQTQRLE
jgi:hypothetical protein